MEEFDFNEKDLLDETLAHKKESSGVGKFLSVLPTVVLTIALFSLSALSTLINFNFSFKDIVWASFLTALFLRIATAAMSKYLGSNSRYQVGQKSPELLRLQNKIRTTAEKINYAEFRAWIIAENKKRKLEAYMRGWKRKAADIDEQIGRLKIKPLNDEIAKKITKLEYKKREIEYLTSEDYIKKYLDTKKVKYIRLDYRKFVTAFSSDGGYKREIYSINEKLENGKEILKGLPTMIFISLLSAMIGFSVSFGQINVISCITDIVNITLQFMTGWFFIGSKTLTTEMCVFISKEAILDKFMTEKAATLPVKSEAKPIPAKETE